MSPLLAALLLAVVPTTLRADAPEPDARALFLANCATCHGETGDGKGVTQLDRPARSFKDGGFSFGNTPEALFRTITTGIPGTPMPGFAGALSDDERRAIAAYVRTLGPPVEDVETSDAELVVGERTAVVRGLLPPIVDGAPLHPRGLLIGTPSGLTFEYRADDVALLGVRQGAFVRRTDWGGRGGTPLEPLGRVVFVNEGGVPRPAFEIATAEPGGWEPLRARLASTHVPKPVHLPHGDGPFAPPFAPHAVLQYDLVDGAGREVALVTEVVGPVTTSFGSGFERSLRVRHLQQEASLRVRLQTPGTGQAVPPFTTGRHPPIAEQWHVARRDDVVEAVGARARDGFLTSPAGVVHAHLPADEVRPGELKITTLLLPAWDEDSEAKIREAFDAP